MRNAKKFDVKMLAIWLIVLVAFAAVAFLLPIARNAVFYIAFSATLISFGLVVFAYIQSFLHDDTLSSKLLGFPIFRVSLIALFVQLVIFAALTATSSICPLWLAVIVEGLVFAGSAVCLIATEAARGVVEEAELKPEDRTQTMKRLRALAVAKMSIQKEEQAKEACRRLADALKYADPVSTQATQELEQKIEQILETLEKYEIGDRLSLIEQAQILLQQRNAFAKTNKEHTA